MNPNGHSTPPEIRLSLTLPEINFILETLGAQPFARVHELIAKLQHQAQTQIAGAERPEQT